MRPRARSHRANAFRTAVVHSQVWGVGGGSQNAGLVLHAWPRSGPRRMPNEATRQPCMPRCVILSRSANPIASQLRDASLFYNVCRRSAAA